MRFVLAPLLLLATFAPGAPPREVTILADRDATLIEDPDGARANGTGPLFAGRTNQGGPSKRRALLRFDVAGALPDGAVVESVELTLRLLPSNAGGPARLHRVLEDWSEGPSFAGGGGGAPAQPGDVTWLHTSYPLERWLRPGGHFVARASAIAMAGGADLVTWTGGRHMLEDVRLWQHAPSRNFGWILIGDETRPQSAQSFAGREDPDAGARPRLTVRYRLPGRR